MAQVTDRTVGANPTGFDMRTELNNIIAALESDNSGSSEPLNPVAYMKWLDTSNATYYYYKERNHDNTAWVTLFRYTVATKVMEAVSNGVVLNDVVVHKTGDETIEGVKTFSNPPIVDGKQVSTGQRKNYLVNGNFDKWDYATSQTTSGYGSDNRWNNANIGSTKTHSRVACTDTERALFNATYFSRTVVNSVVGTSNYVHKIQSIEDVTKLAGKTVTLSFWAKADSNKNIGFKIVQFFGTGGSPSAFAISNQQAISLTTTWQKKTITLTIPSIIGKTLGTDGVHTTYTRLDFEFDLGSSVSYAGVGQQSGTFDIAQVRIEDGSIATDGWHPYDGEFGGEVQACERYLPIFIPTTPSSLVGLGYSFTTIDMLITFEFHTKTRVQPTGVVATGAGFVIGNGAGAQSSSTNFTISAIGTDRVALDFITTGLTVGQGGYAIASNLTSKFYLTGCEL